MLLYYAKSIKPTKKIPKKPKRVQRATNAINNNINIKVHTETKSKRRSGTSTKSTKQKEIPINMTPQVVYRTERAPETTTIQNQLTGLPSHFDKLLKPSASGPMLLANGPDDSHINSLIEKFAVQNVHRLTDSKPSSEQKEDLAKRGHGRTEVPMSGNVKRVRGKQIKPTKKQI